MPRLFLTALPPLTALPRLGALLLALLAPGAARADKGGGALDRFQSSHTDSSSKPDSSGGSPSPSASSSSSDLSVSDPTPSGGDPTAVDASSSSGSYAGGMLLLLACLTPPLSFACLMPSHRFSVTPYAREGLYIEPEEVPWTDDLEYREADLERLRHVEVGVTAFRALNEAVLSHELAATAWLQMVVFRFQWEHLYERIETTGAWDHLDIFRGHIGANVFGPFVPRAELYMMVGALVLYGNGEAIPAFDIGGDLRVYPARPLALHLTLMGSVFGEGPALFDTRLEAGIAIGQAEVRAGARFLSQSGAQGFWGPTAALVGRF
jgi:hypothetical protein